jgi:exonuclease SbcC
VRLDTLRIKGVLAFEREIAIDFKDLPPGLVALVGPNGHGKSTIMESPAAAWYREYPSREKSIFEYAHGTDAFIESTIELEGRGLFRARLNLDKPHRKAEGTISRIEADGRAAILNDGKVSTYDATVTELLPPLNDLLASVLAVQTKKGSFSAQDRKARRELFASLLGLDHLEATAERARQAVDRVNREVARLSAERDALARLVSTDQESAFERRSQQLQVDGGTAEARREELRRLIAMTEQKLSTLKDAAARHAAARERFDRLEADRLRMTTERDEALGAISRMQRELTEEHTRRGRQLATWLDRNVTEQHDESAMTAEGRRITQVRDAVLEDAKKRIAANEGLKAQATDIRAAVDLIAVIDAGLAMNADLERSLLDTIETLTKRERVLLDSLGVIAAKETELARAEKDAGRLSTAPFGDDCAPCAFMTDAAEARTRIPGLTEAIASKAVAEAELTDVRGRLDTARAALAEVRTHVEELKKDRGPAKALADKLPDLSAAEERIAHHQRRMADAEQQHTTDLAAAQQRHKDRVTRLKEDAERYRHEHADELQRLHARVTGEIAELTAKAEALAAAITTATSDRDAAGVVGRDTKEAARLADVLDTNLATHRAELEQVTTKVASIAGQVDDLRRRREEFAAHRATLDATEARIEALRTELVEWNALGKTFGREGLQTLEIDNAGPAVSSFCNDLLRSCFSGRFSVELITQAPKASKGKDGSTHKEVFELTVFDNEKGGDARDISDLSGGQRVIVEEAFRSAIALLVNTRSTFPLRTCWRDESMAALYPETAIEYMTLLRRVQEVGGFHQLLFATHNPECARLADAQIFVANGDYRILYPPFADAPLPEPETVV